jgi:uncharacterized protein YcbK (DUF882 family)
MGDLSAHFSSHEFRDKRTGEVQVATRLVERLERLRTICRGRPLTIVSGYRSASTNTAVGGAKRSQHLYGRAVDIPSGYATEAQARAAGFRGIGLSAQWAVHLDVRPTLRVVTWRYR